MAVTIDPTEFRRAMRLYPERLFKGLSEALETSGYEWQRSMERRFGGQSAIFPDRNTSDHLSNRSARLRRSLSVTLGGSGKRNGVALTLASRGTSYAAIQQFGGTIKPKNGKWLWIPLKANVTPAGVTRKSPRALLQDKKNVFFHGRTVFLLKGKTKRSKKQDLVPMFALLKQVTIPGPNNGRPSRFAFFETWEKLADSRTTRFRTAMRRAVEDGQIGVGTGALF